MKKKSLLFILLLVIFAPLAMNAQVRTAKMFNSDIMGSTQLEKKASTNEMSSNTMLSKVESAREAALEELNGRGGDRATTYSFSNIPTSGWSTSGGTKTINEIDWTYSSSTYIGATTSAIQIGSRNNPQTSNWTIQTPISSFGSNVKVTSVSITGYTTRTTATYDISINGTSVKSGSLTTSSATYSATNLDYTSGNIVVTMKGSTNSRAMYLSNISVTYEEAGCSAPTNFATTNVGTTEATLSWTETGTSDIWVVYYMSEEDEDVSYEIAETNPFTLTGLEMEMTYYALVVPYCGDLDQDSDVITFTTETTCPKPTNLSATNVAMATASVSWDGDADSYSVRYRTAETTGSAAFADDFEEDALNNWDWTTYSNGGTFSGYGWFAYNPQSLTTNFPTAHSGEKCAISLSYGSSALTADNYLVTPQVDLGGTLKFWIMSNYSDEYEVLLSTGGNAVRDFTVTLQAMEAAPSSWTEVSIDLSRYAGQQGYIAIHHSFYDGWGLFLDDFGIYGEVIPAGSWVTVSNVNSPYTITGLAAETEYEWQVQAVCGGDNGQSAWVSAEESFTTGSACDAPFGLATSDITHNSAALSWTGYTDTYNVQYREFDPTELVTVILTAGDVWGDGSGYQMLLDADATAYDNFSSNGISDYSIFEYLIPTNADYNADTENIVVNNSVSIQIPAGTYDCFFANPTPDDAVYVAGTSGNVGGRIDNYEFVAGKTYEFVPSRYGTGDGIDVTITADWTTVNGVTNPYTLTGLTKGTDYEVQVQSVNCDGEGGTSDWSESVFFTTSDAILVESITVNPNETEMNVDATYTILFTVLPEDATNKDVTFSSDDETIATVNENGDVTGLAAGTAVITIAATDGSGVTGTFTVTVMNIDVEDITANDISIITGETATINYQVLPAQATDKSVSFTSADETIATVDGNGVVTGVAPGETTITIASVQNPDVTTEITVTVGSNPNAVKFTLNIDKTEAAPGDVITVEAYLNAPEEGDYTGFTGLVLGLHFDQTTFAVYGNPEKGPVANSCTMAMIGLPNETHPDLVQCSCVMPVGTPNTTTGLVFTTQFTVLEEVEFGSYTFFAEPTSASNFVYAPDTSNPSNKTPILYEYVASTVEIMPIYTKTITGYDTNDGGYYLIASPVTEDVTPTVANGFLTDNYDLYRYNHTADLEWENWKQEGDHFNFPIETGRGYLYASKTNTTLKFTGTLNENADVTLTYNGWNLIGNSSIETRYVDGEFYIMGEGGSDIVVSEVSSVKAMEGIFVNGNASETVTFSETNPNSKATDARVILDVVGNNSKVIDRAIVNFDRNNTLPKFMIDENNTKLYIPQEDADYAVISINGQKEIQVNFKAASTGEYTLRFKTRGINTNYMHLIDRLTGEDVNILTTPEYSFVSSTMDAENRFVVRFSETAANSVFAYQSGNDIIVNGNGELQVFDIMGRMVMNTTVNGTTTVNLPSNAVYIFRMVGETVNTQKIVVR